VAEIITTPSSLNDRFFIGVSLGSHNESEGKYLITQCSLKTFKRRG
jgi:hypothetical protein